MLNSAAATTTAPTLEVGCLIIVIVTHLMTCCRLWPSAFALWTVAKSYLVLILMDYLVLILMDYLIAARSSN